MGYLYRPYSHYLQPLVSALSSIGVILDFMHSYLLFWKFLFLYSVKSYMVMVHNSYMAVHQNKNKSPCQHQDSYF